MIFLLTYSGPDLNVAFVACVHLFGLHIIYSYH